MKWNVPMYWKKIYHNFFSTHGVLVIVTRQSIKNRVETPSITNQNQEKRDNDELYSSAKKSSAEEDEIKFGLVSFQTVA